MTKLVELSVAIKAAEAELLSLRNKVTKLHDEFDLEVFNVQVGRMQQLHRLLSLSNLDPLHAHMLDVLAPDHTGSVCNDTNIRTLDTSCARCAMLMALQKGHFAHGTSFKVVFNDG